MRSPLFILGPLPDNKILQNQDPPVEAPKGTISPSVGDGYFAMVKPLSVGKHTLEFGRELVLVFPDASEFMFIQTITCEITVVPRG